MTQSEQIIRNLTVGVQASAPDTNPSDIARILSEWGFISRFENRFEVTESGRSAFGNTPLPDLVDDVADHLRDEADRPFEKYKCYQCERVLSRGHFGPNCQFEVVDEQVHRQSISPCNKCLAKYHISEQFFASL